MPTPTLTGEQLAQMARTGNPAPLAMLVTHGRWKPAPHLTLLTSKLSRIQHATESTNTMVFMPPRHGKSHLISEIFPASYLGLHPDNRVIMASYGSRLSKMFGSRARVLMDEWGPSVFGVAVSGHGRAGDDWNIAHPHRGGMYTAGVGGAMTGRGFDLGIIDDPVKDAAEARSQTVKERNWEWWQTTFSTRAEPNAHTIIVMTRWDEDDLAGRILDEDGRLDQGGLWDVVSLPAIAEGTDDVIGRQEGEALWPWRYPLEVLRRREQGMDPYWWAALYQQRPAPLEGGLFNADYFLNRFDTIDLSSYRYILQSVDANYKEGVGNDYSVIATWGVGEQYFDLLDVWRQNVDYPDLLQGIIDQWNKWRAHGVLIEDTANGIPAIQALKRHTTMPVIPFQPHGSKLERAQAVTYLFKAGRIRFLHDAPWVREFIQEHLVFPNGAHDDQVDTTSQFLLYAIDPPPVDEILQYDGRVNISPL